MCLFPSPGSAPKTPATLPVEKLTAKTATDVRPSQSKKSKKSKRNRFNTNITANTVGGLKQNSSQLNITR